MEHTNTERFYAFRFSNGNLEIVLECVSPNSSKIKLWNSIEDVHTELGSMGYPYRIFSTHRPLESAIYHPENEREAV
jgi:hypothetical protein